LELAGLHPVDEGESRFQFVTLQTEMENRLRYGKEWAHDGARNGKNPTSLHLRTKGEHPARTSDRARAGERRVRQAPDSPNALLPVAEDFFREGKRRF
jgi:hypothetical protein